MSNDQVLRGIGHVLFLLLGLEVGGGWMNLH